MPELSLEKRGNALLPRTKAAQIELARMKDGPVQGNIRSPRNVKFHRLYWQMCTYIAEALNSGPHVAPWDQERVSDRLKCATGYADAVPLPRATARRYGAETAFYLRPQSISFARMDQDEFSRFVESCIAYVLTEFGPWVQDHEDWRHVREIVAHATQGREAA